MQRVVFAMSTQNKIGRRDALTVAMDHHITRDNCMGVLTACGEVRNTKVGPIRVFHCMGCNTWVHVPVDSYDVEDIV